MAKNDSKQFFRETEYLFSEFFKERMSSVVRKEFQFLRGQQEHETRTSEKGFDGFVDAASPFSFTAVKANSGYWNQQTTLDLFKKICDDFQQDKELQKDLRKLAEVWKGVVIRSIGKDNYAKLSAQVPGKDLSRYFVLHRMEQMVMEQLARYRVPRSSLQWVLTKGFGDTAVGAFANLFYERSDFDEQLYALADKLYEPSPLEKIAASAVGATVDAVTIPIGGAATRVLGGVADFGLRAVTGAVGKSTEGNDAWFGEMLFGDSEAFSDLRKEGRAVRPSESSFLTDVNKTMFDGKLAIPAYKPLYSPSQARSHFNKIYKAAQGDCSTHFNNVNKVIKAYGLSYSKGKIAVADTNKSDEQLMRLSSKYLSFAIEMKRCGMKKHSNIDGRPMTLEEVTQKAYNYAYTAVYRQQQAQHHARQQEEQAVRRASQVPQGQYSQQYYQSMQPSQQPGRAQGVPPQAVPSQDYGIGRNGQYAGLGSWGGLFDNLGLSGLGDLRGNMGYIIAMLPDLLISMLTGKSQSLHLKDNLLPFAAIFGGLFVKNPMLKMLLMGLGGANLLNKAGHEILSNAGASTQQQTSPKRYVHYADEPLDARVSNTVMKGNALVADIDGKPSIIYIDEKTCEAYYKDKIPLNVLCNAVLAKYDEQQRSVREGYERGVDDSQERQRSVGIK